MFISKSIWKLFDERLSKITWIQYTSNRFTLQSFINYTISYRSELELKLNFMLFENNMHALKMNEVMWTKLLKIIILRERRKGKHKTSQIHSHDDQFWYLFLNKLQLNEIALLTTQIISLLLNSLVQFNCKYCSLIKRCEDQCTWLSNIALMHVCLHTCDPCTKFTTKCI